MNAENRGTTWNKEPSECATNAKLDKCSTTETRFVRGCPHGMPNLQTVSHHNGPSRLAVFCGSVVGFVARLRLPSETLKDCRFTAMSVEGAFAALVSAQAGSSQCASPQECLGCRLRSKYRRATRQEECLACPSPSLQRGEHVRMKFSWDIVHTLCKFSMDLSSPHCSRIGELRINNPAILPKLWISAEGASHM